MTRILLLIKNLFSACFLVIFYFIKYHFCGMKYYLFFLLLFGSFDFCIAQDSTEVNVPHPQRMGFYLGGSYSNLSFESKPYFVDSAGKVGRSNIKNAGGISAGICYYLRLSQWVLLRPAIEINMLPAKIEYDTEINHRTSSRVFPFALETPLSIIISKEKNPGINERRKLPDFIGAIRPVFSIPALADVRPAIKTFNLNLDIGIGYPIELKAVTMRTELFYSFGLYDLIGKDENDYKTNSVQSLGRSFIGLRLFFN